MILLPNYVVSRRHPQLFPFGVILAHPDDIGWIRENIKSLDEAFEEIRQLLTQGENDE